MNSPEIIGWAVVLLGIAALLWFSPGWRRPAPRRLPREQAAAVCYRRKLGTGSNCEFLIVRTNNGRRWIFPKGRIEPGEKASEAAAREAREEAGVEGRITGSLDSFLLSGEKVAAFLLEVTAKSRKSPVERKSAWFDREQAEIALRKKRTPSQAAPLLNVLENAHRQLTGGVQPDGSRQQANRAT